MTSNIVEPVIAYKVTYARIQGKDGKPLGTDAALFLCQALYWSERYPDGFYKSFAEWEEETGLSRSQQRTAREKLRDIGILVEWEAGYPLTLHFRVDAAALHTALETSVGRKSPTASVGRKSPTASVGRKSPTDSMQDLAISRAVLATQYAGFSHSVGRKSPTNIGTRPAEETTTEIITETTQERETPAAGEAHAPPKLSQEETPSRKQTKPSPDDCAKRLLMGYRSVRFPGNPKAFLESEWQAFRPNLRVLAKDGYTPEQMAEATRNALARFADKGMVNPRSVARHIEALLEPEPETPTAVPARASPPPEQIAEAEAAKRRRLAEAREAMERRNKRQAQNAQEKSGEQTDVDAFPSVAE